MVTQVVLHEGDPQLIKSMGFGCARQFGRRLAPDLWQFGQRAMCDSSYGFFTPILKAGEKWHNGLLNL